MALAVGRFVEKKGFEYFIRAMALVGDRSPIRGAIIGDGPLRPSLESLARDLGVIDRIDFLGWRTHDEVSELMHQADLLVAPSVIAADGDMEGMPLVIAEAMSTGLPVLGTRHSGIPEAVRHGENGIVVEERDAEALAEARIRSASFARKAHEAGVLVGIWTVNDEDDLRDYVEDGYDALITDAPDVARQVIDPISIWAD